MATSNTQGIIKAKKLDTTKLEFSKVNQNTHGGNQVWVTYGGKPLMVQLPKMRAPFGVSTGFQDKGYQLQLTLRDHPELLAVLNKLDEAVKQTAINNCEEWFEMDETTIRSLMKKTYSPIVKVPTDKKTKKRKTDKEGNPYPEMVRVKLQQESEKDGEDRKMLDTFTFLVYGKAEEKGMPPPELNVTVDNIMETVPPGSEVTAVLKLNSIWFMNGTNFGLSCRLAQMQVFPSNRKIKGFAIQDDSDDERELPEYTETESNGASGESENEVVADSDDASAGETGGDDDASDPESTLVEETPKTPEPPKTTRRKPATRGRGAAALRAGLKK